MSGVGTRVKNKMAVLGIRGGKSCSCDAVAAEMDLGGPAWVRENIEYVLGKMESNAAKKRLPFIKHAAKWLVLLCCREEEAAIARGEVAVIPQAQEITRPERTPIVVAAVHGARRPLGKSTSARDRVLAWREKRRQVREAKERDGDRA